MGSDTKIEWADHTFNPWTGCTPVSAGCDHCYAARGMRHFGRDPRQVTRAKSWRIPRKWDGSRVFVCSWSDFFHPDADGWRQGAWHLMAARQDITWLILTKRPGRMLEWITGGHGRAMVNAWLGVTVEDQAAADKRVPLLLQTPAAKRFVSCEPLLGPVDLMEHVDPGAPDWAAHAGAWPSNGPGIDWVIAGGESGPDARPMHPNWVRGVRDQCQAAGVPFFFKQWGEWFPTTSPQPRPPWWTPGLREKRPGIEQSYYWPDGSISDRIGKKIAGRQLDGREWMETP